MNEHPELCIHHTDTCHYSRTLAISTTIQWRLGICDSSVFTIMGVFEKVISFRAQTDAFRFSLRIYDSRDKLFITVARYDHQ